MQNNQKSIWREFLSPKSIFGILISLICLYFVYSNFDSDGVFLRKFSTNVNGISDSVPYDVDIFDNRIFVDYKSLPYIVLKIDEIGGLYSGTNSITNNTFAKLLWDKDHTSEVTQESKTYSRQYKN